MAGPAKSRAKEGKISGEVVPITEVVLFSSGVGYFSRAGKVTGDALLELTFSSEQVNDLLKSMVVLDLDGGQVAAVSYASHDPSGKALQAFGLDLAQNPSLTSILVQLRGVRVGIASPDGNCEGTVVGVETRSKKTDNGDFVSFDVLSLLTDEGILQFPVEDLRDIKILDGVLQEDMNKALAVIAKSRDKQKRAVSISFAGDGERNVNVSYILETPVWKTSYRLVLSEKPLLQGWAIVDNTTDSDWNGVNLSLVAGRPISFVQDLYTPLYLPRPVVQPQLYGGLRPVMHAEALEEALDDYDEFGEAECAKESMAPPSRKKMRSKSAPSVMAALSMQMMADPGLAASSMAPAASGGDVGELFQYTVNAPVSVGRQSSAMLPILAESIEADKLSIFNAENHPTHPYNGFKMKNTSILALLSGPVTVFDEGVYGGDVQMPNIQPGEERILSYALDLACKIETINHGMPTTLFSMRISSGVIQAMYKEQAKTEYLIKNKKDAKKTVLVEHPCSRDWELIEPDKFEERTDTHMRFKGEVEPGATSKLVVLLEHVYSSHYYLTDMDSGTMAFYISSDVASDKVKAALEEISDAKKEMELIATKRERLEARKDELFSDQDQIRSNLSSVPDKSKLYNRYLAKLEAQEDELDKIEEELETIREQEETMRRELAERITNLDVE